MNEVRVDRRPFDLVHAGETGALCLHGLTGTPWEVRAIGEALAARGVRARGPLVAGHEGGHRMLARVRFDDWVESARRELERLRASHDRVLLVGLSLGGLISLRLAQTERIDGLAVIGTPLGLAQPVPLVVPWLKHLLRFLPKDQEGGRSDIQDPVARARHPGLAAMPLASVHELLRLSRHVIADLHRIDAPIFVAHGRRDRTARPADAKRLFEGVSSKHKRLLYLDRSGHVVTVDHDGPGLVRAAVDFLLEPA